jgi:phospholipid N-methyltransferase
VESAVQSTKVRENQFRKVKNFIAVALKDYIHAGALFPSSPFATRAVVKHVPENSKVIVEFGPGNGSITRELLKKLAPDGALYGIELNDDFVEELREINDPRLKIVHGDVVEMTSRFNEWAPVGVDVFVSGIPFSFIDGTGVETIVEATRQALKPEGRFVVYQNSVKMGDVLKYYFPKVKFSFEPRNFMPYFIFTASK